MVWPYGMAFRRATLADRGASVAYRLESCRGIDDAGRVAHALAGAPKSSSGQNASETARLMGILVGFVARRVLIQDFQQLFRTGGWGNHIFQHDIRRFELLAIEPFVRIVVGSKR